MWTLVSMDTTAFKRPDIQDRINNKVELFIIKVLRHE